MELFFNIYDAIYDNNLMKGVLETAMSKSFNAFISVVHSHSNSTFSGVSVNFHFLFTSIISLESNFECSWLVNNKICCLILISVGVSSNDDWFLPSWNESGDVFNDDGFSKDSSIENVSDSSIGTFPHLLELELLNSCFVRSDGGTLDTDFALFDSFSSFNGDFVISFVSVLHSEIKVLNLDVKEGKDEFVLDGLPDDSGHLVSIEFSDWVGNLDFSSLHLIRYYLLIDMRRLTISTNV